MTEEKGIETRKCLNCNGQSFAILEYFDGKIRIVCADCYDDILEISEYRKELTSSLDVEPKGNKQVSRR